MSWLRPAWFSSLLYPSPRALRLVSYRPPGFSVEDETCVRDMGGRPRSQHALTHTPQHTPNVPSRTFHAQHDHCGGLRLYRAQPERSLSHYPTPAAPMSCRAPCMPKCERAFGWTGTESRELRTGLVVYALWGRPLRLRTSEPPRRCCAPLEEHFISDPCGVEGSVKATDTVVWPRVASLLNFAALSCLGKIMTRGNPPDPSTLRCGAVS